MKTKKVSKELDHNGNCPFCKCSWDGGTLFDSIRKSPHYVDLTDEQIKNKCIEYWGDSDKRLSKLIGIEVQGKYDGISYWKCPDCETYWDRWTNEIVKPF